MDVKRRNVDERASGISAEDYRSLVTARSAPSDKRVIKTLREWGVRIDESLFLGGMTKNNFLESFDADIFFDDQKKHIISAIENTTSGHVPYGIKNE